LSGVRAHPYPNWGWKPPFRGLDYGGIGFILVGECSADMNTPSAKLLVFTREQLVCIKIVGRANVASSIDFKRLVTGLMDKNMICFVLDLSECLLMDSTFLGVLAGFGLKVSTPQDDQRNDRSIELLNPNVRVRELLENLGVVHLFRLRLDPVEGMPPEAESETPCTEHPKEDVKRNCLEAHQTLMRLSAENALKFKDVAQFLTEDLAKIRNGE
jgi:anti-sigma B factor antagonist